MQKVIETQEDLSEVLTVLKKMINLPCWDARLGYAERLELQIGGKIPSHPKLKRRFNGEWELINNANYWEIYSHGEIIRTAEKAPEAVCEDLKGLLDAAISDVEISFPELVFTIKFSNNMAVKLYPEDDKHNLAYWELFTPGNMVLEFGPNRKWSYDRADIPFDKSRE